MEITIEQLKAEGFCIMFGEHGYVKQTVYQMNGVRYNVYENAIKPEDNSVTVVENRK